jgi:hypothetical protein
MKPATTHKITLSVPIRRTIQLFALAALALFCTGAVAAPNHGSKVHHTRSGRDVTVVSTQPGGSWPTVIPVATTASGYREDAARAFGRRGRPIHAHRIVRVQPGGSFPHPYPNDTMDAFTTPKGHPRHALPIPVVDFPALRFDGRGISVPATDVLTLSFGTENQTARGWAFGGHALVGLTDGRGRSLTPSRIGKRRDLGPAAEGPAYVFLSPRRLGGKSVQADEIEKGTGTPTRIRAGRLDEGIDPPTTGGGTTVDMDTDDGIPPETLSRTPLSGMAPGATRPGWLKNATMEIGDDGNGGLQASAGWTLNFR